MKGKQRRLSLLKKAGFFACLLYMNSVFCASIPLNGPANPVPPFANEKPTVLGSGLDAIVGRRLLLLMTAAGAGLFILSLPVSIAKQEVGSAARALMVVPAKATFIRCLGCRLNMAAEDKQVYPPAGV